MAGIWWNLSLTSSYYSCAKVCGAPPPTPGIISRGLGGEGIGVLLVSGLFGSANGTTSYLEGEHWCSLIDLSWFLGSCPVWSCHYGSSIMRSKSRSPLCNNALIVAVGLSNLQYVDLNSGRNLFIIGFALYNCLSIAGPGAYFA
jgi:nucleobase transporter 1/2